MTTRQLAELTLPRSELERLWTPEHLERLAATYWRYLTRVSAGLLRVVHTADTREIVLAARPFVLLRFRAPHYDLAPTRGAVTWWIEGGALVAPAGKGRGFLRLVVERPLDTGGDEARVRVSSEVVNFYPLLAFGGSSWASKLGRLLYAGTQLQLHVLVTHGFLRSLERLDLVQSSVGALRGPVASGAATHPAAR